jgi:hypothetical protein
VSERDRGPRLPDNYQAVLRRGVNALEQVEHLICERGLTMPERLLELRDVRGLRGRLGETEPDDWQEGWVLTTLSPLDVAFLERCEVIYGNRLIKQAVRELRIFLNEYLEFYGA